MDITFSGSPANATEMRADVAAVPGVADAVIYRFAQFGQIGSDSSPAVTFAQVLGIEPGRVPHDYGAFALVDGSMDLGRDVVALSIDGAAALGVGVGDRLFFQGWRQDPGGNYTTSTHNVTVAALFRMDPARSPIVYPGTYLVFTRLEDIGYYEAQLGLPSFEAQIQGEVIVDREALVDPYDLEASQRNVVRVERAIRNALLPHAGYIWNNALASNLSNFAGVIGAQRTLYLALSGPVILLGLYLGAVGVDLSHAERRRELAILKTRGATGRQVVGLLLVEGVLGGGLAAVAGLAGGVALSRLLLGVVNPFYSTAATRYDVLAASPWTLILVVVLSVLFMVLVTFRSARRTAGLPIIETLRHYTPGEVRIGYKPTLDLVFVGLAATTYGVVLYSQGAGDNFLTFLVGSLFFVLLPFAPILLILGTTRLLTRWSGRVYEWTARVWRPVAGDLDHVIHRNLRRNPRRAANVAVIVALGMAFGMFILVTAASQLAYQERQIRAGVGADLRIGAPPPDAGFASNVSAIDGVAGVTRMRTVDVTPPFGYASVYAVDVATFFEVTRPEPFYFREIGAEAARSVLATPDQVLITEQYRDEAFLEVGDRLPFRKDIYNRSVYEGTVFVNVTIGGTVRSLPGAEVWGAAPPPAVFGSLETLAPLLAGDATWLPRADRHLVDLEPGADWRAVRDAILALGGFDLTIADEQIEELRLNPVFRAFVGFMEMQIAFIVVILTAGLGIILYTATLERDVEFAAIRARGASGAQVASLLLGEAFSIMLIGLLVGAGMGTLTALVSTQLVTAGPGGSGELLVPLQMVVPAEALLLVLLGPGAMLLTALAVSARVARMDVARVLKIRGG